MFPNFFLILYFCGAVEGLLLSILFLFFCCLLSLIVGQINYNPLKSIKRNFGNPFNNNINTIGINNRENNFIKKTNNRFNLNNYDSTKPIKLLNAAG